jgi:hypothetical protein
MCELNMFGNARARKEAKRETRPGTRVPRCPMLQRSTNETHRWMLDDPARATSHQKQPREKPWPHGCSAPHISDVRFDEGRQGGVQVATKPGPISKWLLGEKPILMDGFRTTCFLAPFCQGLCRVPRRASLGMIQHNCMVDDDMPAGGAQARR